MEDIAVFVNILVHSVGAIPLATPHNDPVPDTRCLCAGRGRTAGRFPAWA